MPQGQAQAPALIAVEGVPLREGIPVAEVVHMGGFGLAVKGGSGGKRLELQCQHQAGLLYVVPSEANWVCSEELLHVHALAGFMKQIAQMDDPRVKEAMRRWGLYYRERPLADDEGETPGGE